MDRLTTFAGAVPLETDLLNTNRNAMIAIGYALQGYLGTGTVVDGFTCTQTTVASMSVQIGPGSIMTQGVVDGSAWSSLSASSLAIIKQGILTATQTFTLTAPTTVGYSVNYLFQVAQQDIDGTPVVLNYYNPSAPTIAWSGPAGAGTTNNTLRQSAATVNYNTGVAAATGTQTTPAVTAGYTPLFVVTVAYGQTTITSTSISTFATAPFISTKLPQVPSVAQSGVWNWSTIGGTANALTATLSPVPPALVAGLEFHGIITAANNGAMTVNANGLGNVAFTRSDGVAFIGGEFVIGQDVSGQYDGVAWRCSSLPPSRASVGRLINTQTLTASGTYTPTLGTTSIVLEATGGGGAGGGCIAMGVGGYEAGAGGGASSYLKGRIASGLAGVSYTIGAGGTGGTGAGGTGGTTSFGSFFSIPGATGGGIIAGSAGFMKASNGIGGLSTTSGLQIISKIDGIISIGDAFILPTSGIAVEGYGGSNPLGTGGGPGAPGNGQGYGSGGGGCAAMPSTGPYTGGNGAPGVIIIYEYA